MNNPADLPSTRARPARRRSRSSIGIGTHTAKRASTGARGGEKLAIKWAKQKGVTLVLAKADFDGNGRAAPFRANDQMLDLEPVCVLTLAHSLNTERNAGQREFGPALNLAQKAGERGIRHLPVRARR